MELAVRAACVFVLLGLALKGADRHSGADIDRALGEISLDPEQTYRVRDLEIARGDIKIYLTEGVLAFATPIAGHRVAAVFTTSGVDAGDAEVVLLPPQRSERASLASFIKTPNLDEHLNSAAFFFADNTADELLTAIQQRPVRKAPETAVAMAPEMNRVVRQLGETLSVRLVRALLDNHKAANGFFYGVIGGRDLGVFNVMYDPPDFEPVSAGRTGYDTHGVEASQLWTAFRPRRAPPYVPPAAAVRDYKIDSTIHPDLSMSVTADLSWRASPENGRVISFELADRLLVSAATVDGQPVEVFQRPSPAFGAVKRPGKFLLIAPEPFEPGSQHVLQIAYSGTVIRQSSDKSYFVDERNDWYPATGPVWADFDLTFHCSQNLHLVSTGEPVSDEVENGIRTVHRKTSRREPLAGFNLGEYPVSAEQQGKYRVECDANGGPQEVIAGLAARTEELLDYYTSRWLTLPVHNVAVSPIDGYFGQGFPGLIYLSNVSYIPIEQRPAELRGEQIDTFFSGMLLAHEVAHQWWGNVVAPADYRTGWLLEAMANYSALQFLAKTRGQAAAQAVLRRYRDDLVAVNEGKTADSAGPLDFGERLIDSAGLRRWHIIVYEKGAWVLHMLHERLGDEAFTDMQRKLLHDFESRPVTNEDFRNLLSGFVPAAQPDSSLALFFETWVYGTGIPKLEIARSGNTQELRVSGVDDDFSADVPLQCGAPSKTMWVHAVSGVTAISSQTACKLPGDADFLYRP